jgi:putative transposase
LVRGFEYRFYPLPEQEIALAKTFGCTRYVYNWALDLRSTAWKERQERIDYKASSAALTSLKSQFSWLKDVSCVPLQQSLRHLQTAFNNFWKHGKAYPAFKCRNRHQSAEFTRSGFQWKRGELTLAKIGKLNIRWSRRFQGDPSTIHVSRTPGGRYYVSFRVDDPVAAFPVAKGAIGIDLGLTCFATLSDGRKLHAPRPLRRKMAQLKRAQKALSRKQKGSKNRDKARVRVARIHQKISDIRRDFLHKLSTNLVRENQTIKIEDLNVRGMMALHSQAGAVADSGWSDFARMLEYKAKWHGRMLIRIDRWYPSSQLCSECGWRYQDLHRGVRQWTCQSCGVVHDRDMNAAINILRAGLSPDSLPSEPCSNAVGNRNHLECCSVQGIRLL